VLDRATLDRALSRLGACTRSQASLAIAAGRVTLNGRVCRNPAIWVALTEDRIELDGVAIVAVSPRFAMLHKPRGVIVSRADERGRRTVFDLGMALLDGLLPVGRLDQSSEGLLLFSNVSAWRAAIEDPIRGPTKRYRVQVSPPLDDRERAALVRGINDPAVGFIAAATATELRCGGKTQWLEITLNEGKNRQIRRLLKAIDREVLRLIRSAVGPLDLGALRAGQARPLEAAEAAALAAIRPATRPQTRPNQARPTATATPRSSPDTDVQSPARGRADGQSKAARRSAD
jgi:23S rRNA pseudouridine2605 synthase